MIAATFRPTSCLASRSCLATPSLARGVIGASRSRGERVWPTPEAETGESRHCHDDLYWVGAPRNTVACGADLGRLLRLKEHYGIDTAVSRLEQLVLAEFRTHFVTFKVSTLL